MKRILIIAAALFFIGFLFFVRPVATPDIATPKIGPGVYTFSIHTGGESRIYRIYAPASYRPEVSMPVLIALHGGGGDIDGAKDFFNLNDLASSEGFLLVFPQGTGKKFLGTTYGTWNAGTCCGSAVEKNVDDVAFISAMLDDIERKFSVDRDRIFATGISNGAMMAMRLACDLSTRIAAIAPAAGQDMPRTCKPIRAVPIFYMHGREDPCSPPDGGTSCGGCFAEFARRIGISMRDNNIHACPSVAATMREWAEHNGCSTESPVNYQTGQAVCGRFANCKADTEFCVIAGLGHTWPGNPEYGILACDTDPDGKICRAWSQTVGPLNPEFQGNTRMWAFFQAHPLR